MNKFLLILVLLFSPVTVFAQQAHGTWSGIGTNGWVDGITCLAVAMDNTSTVPYCRTIAANTYSYDCLTYNTAGNPSLGQVWEIKGAATFTLRPGSQTKMWSEVVQASPPSGHGSFYSYALIAWESDLPGTYSYLFLSGQTATCIVSGGVANWWVH